ncbi:MAG: HAMP domain-containing histidine kinase, partial [Planctomycetota bacterium]|nr:HAMP domain-containing histidine kinase [Planctomycetota bacterium]
RLHAEILVGRVQDIPDPQTSLSKTITNAVEGYDTRVGWIVGSGVVVLVLFLSVLRYGYCGIFGPLRQLHRGARRVAQGDFDYRVKLKRVNTDDEIHELADAFNRMTDRFQEITRDLDAQVQERSQQLVRSERLAGIGFLSAGVAHEINNPLSAIAMAAESLDDRSEELFGNLPELDRKLVRQYLSMIQRESFRCQQITRRLLDFARGQDGANQRFDLTGTIIEVLEMVGHMGKYRERNITLRHTGPVHLEGNGPEIKQVVLNLVANSLEAMEDGGTLDIGVTEQTDAIVILFKDDGCGMTEDVIAHLFEPFFTKRKGGKGTGLGLSISHRIVADHGGTIEATSEGLGKGSTFRVRLPRKVATKIAA